MRRLIKIIRSQIRVVFERNVARRFTGARSGDDGFFSEPWTTPADVRATRYYENLELRPGAPFIEVRKAFRRLQRRYHPDRHASDPLKAEIAEQIAKALNEAMSYFEAKNKRGEMK